MEEKTAGNNAEIKKLKADNRVLRDRIESQEADKNALEREKGASKDSEDR